MSRPVFSGQVRQLQLRYAGQHRLQVNQTGVIFHEDAAG